MRQSFSLWFSSAPSAHERPGCAHRVDCVARAPTHVSRRAGVTTSIVAFGSFALPIKSPQVLDADVGPIVFQMYMSTCIFIVSFLVLITTPWSFTWCVL